MVTEDAPAPGGPASIEVLKRVKATEVEWELKVATAQREAEEALVRRREETAATLKAASAEAEAERARALERARVGAEAEVATILADGRRAAEAAGRAEGKRPQDRRDQVLATVLGPFAAE